MTTLDKSTKLISTFDPRYIPDCVLWLDGGDSSSNSMTLSGTNITTWKDKSTNAYAFAPASAPVATLASYTGTVPRTVVSLAGTSRLASTTNFVWRSNFTVFFVVYTAAGNFIYVQGAVNNYIFTGNNNLVYIDSNTFTALDSVIAVGTPVISSNAWAMFALGYNNGTSVTNYTVNGTSRASTTGTTVVDKTMTATLYINGSASAAYDTTSIAEILHYNRNLSSTERQQVEGYLAWKWGLQTIVPGAHPYISRGPVLLKYAPTEISGCVGWIDASDSTSFTLSGSTVSSITNKNGGGTIAISGSPTWTYNGLNGKYPAFGTNSGGFRLALASSLTNFTHTAFIVTSYSSTPTTAGTTPLAFATASGGSTVFFRVFDFLTGPPARYRTIAFFGSLYSSSATIGPAAANTPFLYSTSFTGTTPINAYYYAGTQTATITAASPAANASHCMIGLDGFTTTSYWQNGRIAEVLVFNRVLTDTERYNIDSYLSYKWGIQGNMPVSHPYKKYYPLKIN